MSQKTFLYAQSGGVTPVINASAAAVIETCSPGRSATECWRRATALLACWKSAWSTPHRSATRPLMPCVIRPGGVFGSCRYKLKGLKESRREYERLLEVLRAHQVDVFFYNGGNDSADTALKIAEMAKSKGLPLQCIAIPKTIDNDLVGAPTTAPASARWPSMWPCRFWRRVWM
jgi:ATP-dependent phosphofructokinase / diphosphate-dependent phosphofructokinase